METSEKRQLIIDTALSLFAANGFHAVGIDRIIAEADVAKMTMYKYFPSKNDLIEAVLVEHDRRVTHALNAHIARLRTPLSKIKGVFGWHSRWFKEDSFNGCLFINAAFEYPDFRDTIHQRASAHKLHVEDFIGGILAAALRRPTARRLARQLAQILDGAIVAAQVRGHTDAADVGLRTALCLLREEGLAQ